MTRRILIFFILLAAAAGCSSDDSDSEPARVRFVHAAPSAGNADIFIDSIREVRNLEYGRASDYNAVEEGDRRLRVFLDQVVPAVDETFSFDEDEDYSAFFTSEIASYELLILPDDNTASTGDEFRIRCGNLSNTVRSIDVYILRPGQQIEDAVPAVPALGSRDFSAYLDVPIGRYRMVLSEAGSKVPLAATEPLAVASGSTWTLLALDQPANSQVAGLSARLYFDSLD